MPYITQIKNKGMVPFVFVFVFVYEISNFLFVLFLLMSMKIAAFIRR